MASSSSQHYPAYPAHDFATAFATSYNPHVDPDVGNLELFYRDVYSGLGFESTPIAEFLFMVLAEYAKRRADGELDRPFHPPLLTLPFDLSHTGESPASTTLHADDTTEASEDSGDAHGAVTTLCRWSGCNQRLAASMSGVKDHFLAHHLADLEPVERWKDSSLRFPCCWTECDKAVFCRSLFKHVSQTHMKSAKVPCPAEGCDRFLSRGDALARHLETVHNVRNKK